MQEQLSEHSFHDQTLTPTRWQAIKERNSNFDRKFYYGVTTTLIFCRPSCPSRRPLKKNIQIFTSYESAIKKGYRACKRCAPSSDVSTDTKLQKLVQACSYIECHVEGRLTTAELAEHVGLTQYQMHRLFKKYLAITPKSYVDQSRLNTLKQHLRTANSVTEAIYDTGFESPSVIYGRIHTHLGMTPKHYREEGRGIDISFAIATTCLGHMILAATDKGLCYLQFGESTSQLLEQLTNEYPRADIVPMKMESQTQFMSWTSLLNDYLSNSFTSKFSDLHTIPVDIQGTAFQKRVWDFLKQIPHGTVMSYAEVSAAIGSPKACRAVANACANNQIAVLIPCHRVIRGDGTLGGYRWGMTRKQSLIDLERKKSTEK